MIQEFFLQEFTAKKKQTKHSLNFFSLSKKRTWCGKFFAVRGKKAKIGTRFVFGDGLLKAEIIDILDDGNRVARFYCEENFFSALDKIGQMPLPPYITEKLQDKERYQTVYSRELGSAAAPTAGTAFYKRNA